MKKMVGDTFDMLKHTSILFLQVTLDDFLMYRSHLLSFNDNPGKCFGFP